MPVVSNICANVGTYQKDGEEKVVWENVGIEIEKDGKRYLKMNNTGLPVHRDTNQVVNFLNLFPVGNKEEPF